MADERARAIEREAADGDPTAEARMLVQRVRAGTLAPERLELAAYVGHVPAAIALGGYVWTAWGRGCICSRPAAEDGPPAPRLPGQRFTRDEFTRAMAARREVGEVRHAGGRVHGYDCVGRPSRYEVEGPSAHFDLHEWARGFGRGDLSLWADSLWIAAIAACGVVAPAEGRHLVAGRGQSVAEHVDLIMSCALEHGRDRRCSHAWCLRVPGHAGEHYPADVRDATALSIAPSPSARECLDASTLERGSHDVRAAIGDLVALWALQGVTPDLLARIGAHGAAP